MKQLIFSAKSSRHLYVAFLSKIPYRDATVENKDGKMEQIRVIDTWPPWSRVPEVKYQF